ncbi:MAG: purine-nucleoside phosphorylase [Spiroplasma poulsonii]|uniref:Uridine phosphorylase n=1 Tax=Spiroplasma poulsonii TaxID=2138 RepID=A0A2P6FBD2_9MOLU|nr:MULTISPECIES: purine-nucleoside phosphorylase [Spiroplasma]KAF0851181.1 Purine nucleoside phosphorylase DeoD-type [Spiroplasma poulsonii]MBH8622377.1 purine-nucleoside phosphorylase [Spiroplasma sp. hyd1]MBW1241493.1 purine-nucleoside phosphorylase [Spiroplasma poulsonii]MBW3058171.1 purine-nucleoside phosphorylase [Spiroplasma poulsonii]PQM30775.1 Purine nucleoside phosphorylase DeoD-type [Spiroplasma poulsonii]
MTPHINAKKEDIAKTVLMPGDPLRAKFIAETFLENVKLVNEIRNMYMYTGTYQNKPITIAGSGMGCPSIGIYSYELFKFYDVDNIIRIGSAGSYDAALKVYDIVNVMGAYGENNFAEIVAGVNDKVLQASQDIFETIEEVAQAAKIKTYPGIVHSSDVFYRKNADDWKKIKAEYNAVCVEMESFALFANALALNKKAATLLTISDSFISGEVTSATERQNNFHQMVELALQSAIKL